MLLKVPSAIIEFEYLFQQSSIVAVLSDISVLGLCKETILQFPLILWFEPLMVGRAIYKIESRGILKLLLFRPVTSEL